MDSGFGFWILVGLPKAPGWREGRMDAVRAAFLAADAAVAPLRCLNEVGSVAVGTPQRALRDARLVGGALVEQVPLLDELLRSLATIAVVCALLTMYPARDNMTSVAECSACVVCGGRLTTTDQSITLPLFSARGVKTVHLFCRMRLLCDAPPLVRSRRHVSCEWRAEAMQGLHGFSLLPHPRQARRANGAIAASACMRASRADRGEKCVGSGLGLVCHRLYGS